MNRFEAGTVYFIYNTPDGDPTSAIYSQLEGNDHLFYTKESGDELYIHKDALVDSEELLQEDESKYYIIKEIKKKKVVTTPPRRAKPGKERKKRSTRKRRTRKHLN
jgi:hypothetical protein